MRFRVPSVVTVLCEKKEEEGREEGEGWGEGGRKGDLNFTELDFLCHLMFKETIRK